MTDSITAAELATAEMEEIANERLAVDFESEVVIGTNTVQFTVTDMAKFSLLMEVIHDFLTVNSAEATHGANEPTILTHDELSVERRGGEVVITIMGLRYEAVGE